MALADHLYRHILFVRHAAVRMVRIAGMDQVLLYLNHSRRNISGPYGVAFIRIFAVA